MQPRQGLVFAQLAICALLWLLLCFGIRGIDNDYFWHLRTGELMLLNRTWFNTDIYSWTFSGRPWFNHEWLAQVAFALQDRLDGYPMVKAAHGLVILGYLSTLTQLLRCGGTPLPAAMGVATVAGFCTYGIILPRPQAISILGAVIFAWAIYGCQAGRKAPPLYVLPLLIIPWANWHGGFVMGLAWIALAVAGEWLQQHWPPGQEVGHTPKTRTLALVLAAGIAAGLCNPHGWQAYAEVVRTLADPQLKADNAFVGEWQAPQWGQLPHLLLLLFALPALLAGLATWRQTHWSLVLWLLAMGGLATQSIRHIPFAVIALTVLAAHHFPLAFEEWRRAGPPVKRGAAGLAGGWLVLVLVLVGYDAAVKWSHGLFMRVGFPSGPALKRLQSLPAGRRMFNTYGWGGILIYYLYPAQRVYIDGRHWTVYDSAHFRDYFTILSASDDWQRLLAQQRIDLIVVLPDEPLATAARRLPGWRLEYVDESTVILGRYSSR